MSDEVNYNQLKEKTLVLNKEEAEEDVSTLLKKATFEGFATFFFMISIYFSKGDIRIFIFGMWAILCCFGIVSGAHVNPAITFGFYIYEAKWLNGAIKFIFYFLFQTLGCILGAIIARFVVGLEPVYVDVPKSQNWNVYFSEFFFTGTFFFFIAYIVDPKIKVTEHGPIQCALIVGWFYLIVNAGSVLSGAAYNPSVLLVLNTIAYIDGKKNTTSHIPLMIVAEFIGVAVFALIFKYIFKTYYDYNLHQTGQGDLNVKKEVVEAK